MMMIKLNMEKEIMAVAGLAFTVGQAQSRPATLLATEGSTDSEY